MLPPLLQACPGNVPCWSRFAPRKLAPKARLHCPCPHSSQVSDIRRANGLLSDNFIHARDTLLIPKQPLPVG